MSKNTLKLAQIVGLSTFGGKNHRNIFENLGLNEVVFPCELEVPAEGEPADQRVVLWNLVFGPEATEETQKDFLKRMEEEPALWGLAQNIIKNGLLNPIGVVPDGDGYKIVDGQRRYVAKVIASLIAPDIAGDTITVRFEEGDESRLNSVALAENQHRKELTSVELGKIASNMHKVGKMSYKDIASTLGVMTKGKRGQAPQANHQYVRQCALLHDPKVSDEDREAIVAGTKGYTKVLQQRGLLKTNAGNSPEADSDGPRQGGQRKRAMSRSQLMELADSRKKLEQLVEKAKDKCGKDLVEFARLILCKAANVKYTSLEAVETKAEEAAAAEAAAA